MKKRIIIASLFIALFYLLYTFNLSKSFAVDSDFARDIYQILIIARGKFSLIGPPLSVGIFSGPYYHYLFVPALIFSKLSAESILYFNSFLFAGAIGIWYLATKNKLSTMAIGLSPFWIINARHPGNGYSYLPILLVIAIIIFCKQNFTKTSLLAIGVLMGIVLTMHPISVLMAIPLLVLIIRKTQKKDFLFLIFPVLTMFLPLVLFEVKNHFLMTSSFISHLHSGEFVDAQQSIQQELENKSLLGGLQYIWNKYSLSFSLSPIFILELFFLTWFSKAKKYFPLVIINVIAFVLTFIIFRSKFEMHYLLPICLLLLSSGIWIGSKLKYKIIFPVLIAIFLYKFPINFYSYTTNSLAKYASISKFIVNNILVSDSAYNLVHIQDEKHYVVAGDMFRFYLTTLGKSPQSKSNYASISQLLIISEMPNLKPENLNIWEIQKFGKNIINTLPIRLESQGVDIYKIVK